MTGLRLFEVVTAWPESVLGDEMLAPLKKNPDIHQKLSYLEKEVYLFSKHMFLVVMHVYLEDHPNK